MTLSRRSLIGGGAALAGAAAATIASGGTTSALVLTGLSPEDLTALDIPVMLSVTNAKKGELEILVGERALTFTDKSLVAKLASATRKAVA